jgi:hypothetical protein
MRQSWICEKCDSMYVSPIRVQQVLCRKCTGKVGGRETWMTPALDSEGKLETGENNGTLF